MISGVSHTSFLRPLKSSPINDPLSLNKGDMNENIKLYREACKGKDWQSIKLTELAQRAQEDFYGGWIQEMSRIAKVRLFSSSARYSRHAQSNSNILLYPFPAW